MTDASKLNVVDGISAGFSRRVSPEMSASWISRILSYGWLNPLMHQGMRQPLEEEDLYPLNEKFDVHALGEEFNKAWRQEVSSHKPTAVTSPADQQGIT